ncbi:GntP family permease [Mycoplasma sp. P36-A1]|uniref:GntP family permease n=1 Tax=Mycoplasma sp. P36-A1 TaxID=3252900 RepID=UPI003C2EC37C
MDDSTRMLLGLAIGIIVMILLVMKTKVHTFIALLIAAIIAGLIGGMSPGDLTLADGTTKTGLLTAIQDGFGSTLKSTGIIIGLGVMMGGILEKSGAAEKMAYTFIKAVGSKREEWALAITGWFIAIPVFADSALVIFAPLCKALSKVTGKSVVGLALSMAAGLQLTHTMVPPTPGPLTAAGMLGVDVGQMIITGALISVPMLIAGVLYSKWVGKKIYQIPLENGEYDRKEFKEEYLKSMEELDKLMGEKNLPPLLNSIAPIIVPLILILAKTVIDLIGFSGGDVFDFFVAFLGQPIIALGIGTLLSIYGLVRKDSKSEVIGTMDAAIRDTGIIMLITGAGGSLGNVIKVSGIGDALGELVINTPLPAILIPVIIAALMRIALGSATVAITTAASLTAPLMGVLDVNAVLLAQACCIGSISFSYFNDSGFWVFNGMFGIKDIKDQVLCKFAISMIMSGVGVAMLLVLQLFIK